LTKKYANFPMNLRVNFQMHGFFSTLLVERSGGLTETVNLLPVLGQGFTREKQSRVGSGIGLQ